MKPTLAQFTGYQAAYDYFNRKLFGGKLRPCILNFSRGRRFYGFFAPDRWEDSKTKVHEITLNPDWLQRPLIKSFATLVHEMCHQWQRDFGNPSRSGYHNWEWAEKMESVGLIPSDTGEPGGKKVGQSVTHYIAPHGPFQKAFDQMPKKISLPWRSGTDTGDDEQKKAKKKKAKARNKVKYTCPGCATNVWGKPGLLIVCGECDVEFILLEADSLASLSA